MTEQFKAATIRALYGAILTAALTLLTTYQSGGGDDRWEQALIAAGTACLSFLTHLKIPIPAVSVPVSRRLL